MGACWACALALVKHFILAVHGDCCLLQFTLGQSWQESRMDLNLSVNLVGWFLGLVFFDVRFQGVGSQKRTQIFSFKTEQLSVWFPLSLQYRSFWALCVGSRWFLTVLSPFNIIFGWCICFVACFFFFLHLNLNQLMWSPKSSMHTVPAGMPSGCEALLKRSELTVSWAAIWYRAFFLIWVFELTHVTTGACLGASIEAWMEPLLSKHCCDSEVPGKGGSSPSCSSAGHCRCGSLA